MTKVFISYRREDAAHAGRLCDGLRAHFGRDQVFLDRDTIPPGRDFVDAIERSIEASDVIVVLIGNRWLHLTGASGQRKLDEQGDMVRLEIGTALRRGRFVVPVLVGGATMPTPAELPSDIAGLGRLNALDATESRWSYDMGQLIEGIEKVIGSASGSDGYRQNPWFRYAVPRGWLVAEEGPYSVVLISPDRRAATVMTGNSGLPVGYPPLQFLNERLLQTRPQNLVLGPPRAATPIAGFTMAVELDYSCSVEGVAYLGSARCSVAPSYDVATMVATWAGSEIGQWAGYASWLPAVAADVGILSGAAFGARGIARQNLENSIALGEQARTHRAHAQAQWAEVTRLRDDQVDRQQQGFREAIGNVRTWANPYADPDVSLPNDYNHHWMTRDGRILGTDDPTEDPNATLPGEWLRMTPRQPGNPDAGG